MNAKTNPSNLQLRVLTAVIALPITLLLLFVLPTTWLAGLVFVLLAIGLVEWGRLSATAPHASVLYWLVFVLIGPGVFALKSFANVDLTEPLLILAALYWCMALFMVVRFPATSRLLPPMRRGLVGAFLLACTWLGFTEVKLLGGEWLIVWLLAVVWAADSAAYFGGRAWGTRKLARQVSPGKTIEGALTGIVAAGVIGTGLGLLVPVLFNFEDKAWFWILASLVMAMLSILGDLFASLIKRIAQAKDSGTLFPGHGGVLDRLDSLLPTLPLLALMAKLGG